MTRQASTGQWRVAPTSWKQEDKKLDLQDYYCGNHPIPFERISNISHTDKDNIDADQTAPILYLFKATSTSIIVLTETINLPTKTYIAVAIHLLRKLKMSGSTTGQLYGRMDLDGNVALEDENGDIVTSIDSDIQPVDSNQSARNEHPDGITLTRSDAANLGVILEGM